MEVSALSVWLHDRRVTCGMQVRPAEWPALSEWGFDDSGILRHASGGFFSLASVNRQGSTDHTQPIILQPEIGILGFAFRRNVTGTELLLQAKSEPGNVGLTQIAPTVQATLSNYRQRHGGKATPLLAHFEDPQHAITNIAQSEQGTRFLGKYNRNVLVQVANDLEAPDPRYRWSFAADVFALVDCDFSMNTDARSVLVCSDWAHLVADTPFADSAQSNQFARALRDSYQSDGACDEAVRKLGRCRAVRTHAVTIAGMRQATEWVRTDQGFADQSKQHFDVVLVDVEARDREVSRWQQPLLANCTASTVVLCCQMRRNELQFFLRISDEIGFRERCQWGPSANSQVDSPSHPLLDPGFWSQGHVHAEVRQSDEGGRFFQSVVRYVLIEMPFDTELPLNDESCWVTLGQIKKMLRRSGHTNNELRSVLSLAMRWI